MPTPLLSTTVRFTTAGYTACPSGVKNHSTAAPFSRLATTVQPCWLRLVAVGSLRRASRTAATVS
jgi:hypothetical protein